jgi:hypothetical protein
MNTFETDENNDEVLLSKDQCQVMMEWEKPYMEASIDFLQPNGHVLEVGFGCGYSATQIMKYNPKSYTVIECDGVVIKKAKEWAKKYNTTINIVEGTWQEKLHTLGCFDEIYFDDFPLNLNEKSSQLEIVVSRKRLNIFVDLCIQNHTIIGSKICFYLNGNNEIMLSSDTEPFIKKESKEMNIKIPESCRYRNIKEQKCTIPLITKIREYNFEYANQKALEAIMSKKIML